MLRLALGDFRCYRALRLETTGLPVALIGPNGAGKTNILEALSFLVPGRGLRRARLAEIGRRDSPEAAPASWGVHASVATPDGPVEIGTGLQPGDGTEGEGRRVVRIDGQDRRGQTALAHHVAAVWLTPDMDRLFADGASGRRRFLDRLVFGFDAAHAGRLNRYEHALRERARVLGEAATAQRRADEAWLAAIESRLAETGIAVAAARRELIERLNAATTITNGPFPSAELALSGAVEDWVAQYPAVEAEDRLRAALAASRAADAASGGAATGPHRGDLLVRHRASGRAARECSTGEQKALLLSIVLAHARLVTLARGAAPLLLLDEVAAHLDAARRMALFDEICDLGAQAWMTGTDAQIFAPLGARAERFRVEDAAVSRDWPPTREERS